MTDMVCAQSQDDESTCENPCHPDSGCEHCAGYWQEMIAQGYWDDAHKCWTDAGMREMCK